MTRTSSPRIADEERCRNHEGRLGAEAEAGLKQSALLARCWATLLNI